MIVSFYENSTVMRIPYKDVSPYKPSAGAVPQLSSTGLRRARTCKSIGEETIGQRGERGDLE
jgi:hypothetical protein